MSVWEPIRGNLSTHTPALDLHEIQATVLRQRPAPYVGSHVLLRVYDAESGRKFLGRLTPYVDSAARWGLAMRAWKRSASPRIHYKVSPSRFVKGWRGAPDNSGTKVSTIRRIGI